MGAADWGWTAAGLIFGAFWGLIIGMISVLLYDGLWLLFVLLLPLLILQLLFEGAIAGLVVLWRRWRGHQPEPPPIPRRLRTDLPWLRRYGFHIGFLIGIAYGLVAAQ